MHVLNLESALEEGQYTKHQLNSALAVRRVATYCCTLQWIKAKANLAFQPKICLTDKIMFISQVNPFT